MSVYSGFGTRQQESFYNKMVEKSLHLLSKWLLQFFNNGEVLQLLCGFRARARWERVGQENQENIQVHVSDGSAEASATQVQPCHRWPICLSLGIVCKYARNTSESEFIHLIR